jgi:hypothetical protein
MAADVFNETRTFAQNFCILRIGKFSTSDVKGVSYNFISPRIVRFKQPEDGDANVAMAPSDCLGCGRVESVGREFESPIGRLLQCVEVTIEGGIKKAQGDDYGLGHSL